MSSINFKSIILPALGTTAAWTVGLWGLRMQSQLLVPLMERFSVSDPVIGRLFMIENFVFFVSLLFAIIPTAKYSRTKLAISGTILVVLWNLTSAYSGSIDQVMISRCLVSLGAGLVSGTGTASGSATDDPERVYGLTGIIYLMIFALGHAVIPQILGSFGIEGVYLANSIYSLAVIPLFFFLLPPRTEEVGESSIVSTSILDAPHRLIAILALAGVFIYELGQNAVFTYQDKVGDDVGIESEDRGGFIGLAQFVGLIGGGIATWMGTRYGRFKPLSIGLGVNITTSILITTNEDPAFYFFLLLVWKTSYSFLVPYICGAFASLDKLGRWAVAGDAFWNLSATPGPFIATVIVSRMGYEPLAIWVFTTGAIGAFLFCYTARQTDKLGLE
jgi:DHA1 family inner membrane transport protein